jgi:hypothetical protein
MSAVPLVVFRRYLVVVPRSLPRRLGAATLSQQEENASADVQLTKSKFYTCVALNYPGARHHDFCQLQPGSSEPQRKICRRASGSNALGFTAKIAPFF